jgi:hypothetical protein
MTLTSESLRITHHAPRIIPTVLLPYCEEEVRLDQIENVEVLPGHFSDMQPLARVIALKLKSGRWVHVQVLYTDVWAAKIREVSHISTAAITDD